ncbi:hypothetical protein FQZ97_1198710 [compost metagenome]
MARTAVQKLASAIAPCAPCVPCPPSPTSSTRAMPPTPRNSSVEPGLPLMSPERTACVIAPPASSCRACADRRPSSNTPTAMQPLRVSCSLILNSMLSFVFYSWVRSANSSGNSTVSSILRR